MPKISQRVKLRSGAVERQAKVPDLWKKMEKENKEKHWVHLGPTRTVPIGAAFSSQKFESVIRSSAPMRLLGSKAIQSHPKPSYGS